MPKVFTDNLEYINVYHSVLAKAVFEAEDQKRKFSLLLPVLNHIALSAEEYDQTTNVTSRDIGDAFLRIIRSRSVDELSMQRLFYLTARFVRESTLRRSNYITSEQKILDFFYDPASRLNAEDAQQADYIQFHIPHRLLEYVSSSVSHLEARLANWSSNAYSTTDALEQRINGHRSELLKIEKDFNFVGLASAFKKLNREKRKQKWWSFASVVFLGAIAIAVPLFFLAETEMLKIGNIWGPDSLAKLIGGLAIEVIILYFFRVALRSYLVIRSQITSLDLRYALCAFIEGYSEFAKAKGAASLSGFESLIFSALPQDDASLPATIDWLDQVTKLVAEARK